ncbi:hypothetical protein Cni_G07951 [Canna indica]|uniref:Protein kinase domain-containing protein n=1 Tax=Canna indica TaxID=4628 RepID=A0AAQ3K1B3_9LILI|nr:hypothetical protein Cni_G07951 [Canna indica]
MGASQSPESVPVSEEAVDGAVPRGGGGGEKDADLGGEEEETVADICGNTWEVSLFERQSPEGVADGLYVYHNMFHLVPSEIGRLRRLKTLKFFANEVEVLPPEAGELVELERLQVKVSSPGISGLPFRKLKSLSELELCQVPPRLSALSILSEISGLKCLTKLSVSNFSIRYLPPEICNLQKLEELDLSFNKLKNLPDDIAELGSLKMLKVANNKLIDLPSSISFMSSLEKLDLSNNRLTSLTSLRLASMLTLQHLNLQYNKLRYGCQVPSWIRCNFEGNFEGNTKDENCKSSAVVGMHEVTVRRTHWNHSCSGFHGASSCSHSEASPSFRCHAIKKMKRMGWKRHSYLQQKVRQERLNHSRKWKDHNHNMNIKMVEENDSSALLEHENRQSGLQISINEESLLDDSAKQDALHDDFTVDSDECCLAKDGVVLVADDSAERNEVGSHKNLYEEHSSCNTSISAISNKNNEIESETEDNYSWLHTVVTIDAPDDHSCEASKFISKSKRHSDKDLANPKPTKFRKPVEDFSNLSCKYSIQSICSIDDHIPDGFYDAGRDRQFKPLQDFEQNLSLDSREVILLDRDKDEELDAIVFSAQLLMSSLRRSSLTGIEENVVDNLHRASILALFVSDCFGGSERSTLILKMRRSILGLQKQQPFVCTCPVGNIYENNGSFKMHPDDANFDFDNLCENSLRFIKKSRNSSVVPIGKLRFGICRHRAVLMKYLCDRVDPPIPCELVRGYIDFMPHAWNVVRVRRGDTWLRMVIDACYPTDIREETDLEYFCRYIPLSRLHVLIGTQNSTTPEWSFPSPPLNHGTKIKSASSVCHYKVGTVDTALKVRHLKVDQASDKEIRDFEYKLLGEVRILGALRNHRCIVDIYGHQLSCKWVPGTDGNKEFRLLRSMIIMEYVNGGSLKNYLVQLRKEGQKHVPAEDALCIARDVACALVEVHSKQIIHRDIKSENILVDFDRSGGRPIIKLSDFDRSVPLNCFAHTCCIAHRGIHPPDVCVGTPRWMAPEVVQAMHQKNRYGLEVDIWSYGCLLLELLTLQLPYQGLSESEYYDLLQVQQRPRLTPELEALASSDEATIRSNTSEFSDADAEIFKLLTKLFYQCTSANPSDRPSAKDIYDSLSVIAPRLEEAGVIQHSD